MEHTIDYMTQYLLNNEPISLDSFIEVNKETFTDQDISNINNLQPGEHIMYGGGAAPEFILKRIN